MKISLEKVSKTAKKDRAEGGATFLEEKERLYNEIDRATSLIILKRSDA